jgi:hypothetical protein
MTLIEQFEDLRPGLVLKRLAYYSFDFSLPLSEELGFDEAADAVLDFEGGDSARFTWAQIGGVERLAIGSHAMDVSGPTFSDDPNSADRRRVDATNRWGLAGAVLEGHEVVLNESPDGSQQVWSCRLDFDRSSSLVFALGEVQSGAPAYIWDSILITGDKRLAKSYKVQTSVLSAWGSRS